MLTLTWVTLAPDWVCLPVERQDRTPGWIRSRIPEWWRIRIRNQQGRRELWQSSGWFLHSQLSTGTNQSSFGHWDYHTDSTEPTATPFSPGLGVGTQINAFSKKDGFAPYSQQWNVNIQRELPYNIFVTAAWVGNRVIHLPSQLNAINQLDPEVSVPGQSELGLSFADGSAQAAGYHCALYEFRE